MARQKARFRISIKDNETGQTLKIELVQQPWPGRYWIRQNGKTARHLTAASLSTILARLRSWLVQRSNRSETKNAHP